MYKLYGFLGAGSAAVEAVLAIAGAPYEVTDVERDGAGRFPDWFIKINSLAQIPVLVLPDDSVMTESAAMLLHLADSFPELKLAPEVTSALRPHYLRWMMFLATAIYASDIRMYYPARFTSDANGAAAVKEAAIAMMARQWEVFAAALGAGPHMIGGSLSLVDIYASMLATWNLDVPGFFVKHPNIKALHEAVRAQPAIGKVWARHGM
ncbi:MAG: glutathione S-transferase family protein [Rhizobiales bacterium]|nr:glutathione S-transferase family protein [Hyphomicrobiales bacterium]